MFREVWPRFVSFTFLVACVPTFSVGKVRAFGENATTVPAPLSSMICSLEEALSEIFNSPDALPLVFGRKTMLMSQVAPGATLDPQVLVSWNGACVDIRVIDKVDFPVFVKETVCGELSVPINWGANWIGVVGLSLTTPVFSSKTILPVP